MPAYFNLSLQFNRSELYPGFVKDVSSALERAGLNFLSGHWKAEQDSRDEILRWNQQKLEQDFELGFTEHVSHDYKQTLYTFRDYSEVRGFWMNRYPEPNCFTYEIILPEEEILVSEGGEVFQKEHEEILLGLAERLWEFPYVHIIQTGLEGNDAATGPGKMRAGILPNIQPFAIVGTETLTPAFCKTCRTCGIEIKPLSGRREGWLCRKGTKARGPF